MGVAKGTQKLVPLQEELALLNDYFTIQQYRYGGDLEIELFGIFRALFQIAHA